MAFDSQPAGFYVDLASGVALVALAVLVALVRPRRAVNLAFAGYALAVGGGMALANVLHASGNAFLRDWTFIVGIGLGGASLFGVGWLLDRATATRRHATWPFLAVSLLPLAVDRVLAHAMGVAGDEVQGLLVDVAFSGVYFVLALTAVRTRQGAWTLPAPVAALLCVGLVAAPAFDVARVALFWAWNGSLLGTGLELVRVACFLLCGVVWLAAIPRRGRPALVAGLACFAFPTIGALSGFVLLGTPAELLFFEGSLGLATFAGVGCLAYAILRHQMFDIDLRVKWTLSRGSVALVFLAAFFVAAQLAQNFLSERFGWALGGIAAGVLLFAVAPLQRAAERLSDRAMPSVRKDDPAYLRRRKQETYRDTYAAAWGDGRMTAKEARLLAEVKAALDLPAADYAAIEQEWARRAPKT